MDFRLIIIGGLALLVLAYRSNSALASIPSQLSYWFGGDPVFEYTHAAMEIFPFLSYIPYGLVSAIAKVESSYNPKAVSSVGARGLMQILPPTWTWIFGKYGLTVPPDPFDPYDNVLGGMLYLNTLYEMYGDWDAVIQAYNVGPGAYMAGVRNDSYYQKVKSAWTG